MIEMMLLLMSLKVNDENVMDDGQRQKKTNEQAAKFLQMCEDAGWNFCDLILFQTSRKQKRSSTNGQSMLSNIRTNSSMVLSGIFRGISTKSLSLQSTTPLKQLHG
jgi:hypothetical protein